MADLWSSATDRQAAATEAHGIATNVQASETNVRYSINAIFIFWRLPHMTSSSAQSRIYSDPPCSWRQTTFHQDDFNVLHRRDTNGTKELLDFALSL